MIDPKVLYDQKRCKLLRRARLFHWIPFVSRVFAGGSLAIGQINRTSDFDVIVVARPGRLYTARFFCLLIFGLAGWRRTFRNPADGFCLSCFIVDFDKYLKSLLPKNGSNPAYVRYAQALSHNLIPIYASNESGGIYKPNILLDLIENWLKWWQIRRIEKFIQQFPPNPNSRIIYNDETVELCFNLKEL